jgi:hypothetical protein
LELEERQMVVEFVVAVAAEFVAVVVGFVAVQHRERHRERERRGQQVAPSTVRQAGLSLSAVELEEALALIAVFAFLQGQHKKELEDWSYWRTALTVEQIQQDF